MRDVVVYTVVHQPRRLKLPAQPIPAGAAAPDVERCLFDEPMNRRYLEKVAARCYHPATGMFRRLLDQDLALSVGFSFSFLRQADAWDPALVARLRDLMAHPRAEPVAVEPYHSFAMLIDLPGFVQRMRWSREALAGYFGSRPTVADTTELSMSETIYTALDHAGFDGGFIDGRPWVLEWRAPSFLYHSGRRLALLARHHALSDDVGYRFSDRTWSGWPLMADTYLDWIAAAPGDVVVLGWDYETFGEHHGADTGIFDFVRRFVTGARDRGLRFLTASEAIAAHRPRSQHLPLPVFPSTWAGSGGMEFFLGNPVQQAVFQLMREAYGKAQLSGDPALLDLALWLAQSDNLHLIQWFGRSGSEAEVSAYFTPREWWSLGADRLVWEIQQVYVNFVRAVGGPSPAPDATGDQLEMLEPEVAALVAG
ncbi:MAG: glycoside hydrolase [Candidatus Rokubacteria bacterium]|nr:glycoside hydrolase [Candidatus Rokubacteria bacterium]